MNGEYDDLDDTQAPRVSVAIGESRKAADTQNEMVSESTSQDETTSNLEETVVPPMKERKTKVTDTYMRVQDERVSGSAPLDRTTTNQVETVVPPVKEIREQLNEFEMKVPVWGLTVFTVDGYIIAHKLFYDKMPEEIELAVSSMSAGLITISENFIQMVEGGSAFRQVLVDSEGPNGTESFSILLRKIEENVLITCIFPNSTQLGLVIFEMENLSNSILDIVGRWDIKLHKDTVT
jgi:predicted regulator of Ras-like GTPase activity (Roadblock/LC7/MglB family)